MKDIMEKMDIKNTITLNKDAKNTFDCSSSNTSNSWSNVNFKLGEGATFDIKDNCVGWQKATVHGKLNKEKKAEAKAHISAAGKKGDAVEIDKGLTKFDNAIKG